MLHEGLFDSLKGQLLLKLSLGKTIKRATFSFRGKKIQPIMELYLNDT